MKEKKITKFEIILGLAALSLVALVALPPLHGGMSQEKSIRAVAGAEDIARAILDFRCDTGTWPGQLGDYADLSCLTRTSQAAVADQDLLGAMAGAHATRTAEFRPWLREVPLDPWQRPYRVAIMASARGSDQAANEAWTSTLARTHVYPSEPPEGVAICVVSAGPDGEWNTDLDQLGHRAVSGPATTAAGAVTPAPSVQFGGDDLGFVLKGSSQGGGS